MKNFICSKCNSTDVFIEKSGNNTGLYCSDCGKWITWLNKDQQRLAERQIGLKSFDVDRVLEQLEDYGKHKGILHCEDGVFVNYIPISIAKQIVKARGTGGVLGYTEEDNG
ncbi:hypothetical protein DXC92_19045 [Clostridiales bacterium TF09-2AC]|mgnify:CR=1 FL=1|nr:hypothetical protein DXC92_19045 [Clostridiales bacterium TF09-2AC]